MSRTCKDIQGERACNNGAGSKGEQPGMLFTAHKLYAAALVLTRYSNISMASLLHLSGSYFYCLYGGLMPQAV